MDYARRQFEQRKKMKDQKKTKVVSRRLSVQKEVQLRSVLHATATAPALPSCCLEHGSEGPPLTAPRVPAMTPRLLPGRSAALPVKRFSHSLRQ